MLACPRYWQIIHCRKSKCQPPFSRGDAPPSRHALLGRVNSGRGYAASRRRPWRAPRLLGPNRRHLCADSRRRQQYGLRTRGLCGKRLSAPPSGHNDIASTVSAVTPGVIAPSLQTTAGAVRPILRRHMPQAYPDRQGRDRCQTQQHFSRTQTSASWYLATNTSNSRETAPLRRPGGRLQLLTERRSAVHVLAVGLLAHGGSAIRILLCRSRGNPFEPCLEPQEAALP